MALVERPRLTVAIPTYNRSKLLKRCLDSLILSIKGLENYIEIVICDNNSNDETQIVIKDYLNYNFIRYFVNEENVGFNHNYIKLIDKHVNGEYCWVLGDDDFIKKQTLSVLVNILNENTDLGFIAINYDTNWNSNIIHPISSFIPKEKFMYFKSYKKLIQNVSRDGNILMGFISASIFKTDKIKEINKSFISRQSTDKPYYNMFPHSYYFATSMKDEKALYINEEMFYANIHVHKGWEDNLSKIYFIIQPHMYDYYYKSGFSKKELKLQKQLIIKSGLALLIKNNISFNNLLNKLYFIRRYFLDFDFYKIGLSLLTRKIIKFF